MNRINILNGKRLKLKAEHGRYIILGSIDGILAVLGVVIGTSHVSDNPTIVINAALGGAVALALTNGIGSYLAESAVEFGKLAELEKPLMRSLNSTKLEQETKKKIWSDSFFHGGASFCGSLVPILPFMLLDEYMLEVAIIMSITVLSILGVYSGKLAKQSMIKHSVRMVGLGIMIVTAVTVLGLE
ncbi:VIT1/CCC1 transporter family protein [Methanolobus bombayensis]|uniref:VIT1/CCC1 transporter family protein n=1 Tax=Methanolobus bombayensis TaxID=38023 RepID=UPI001FD75E15|nr:VIT1/CCC1 transporter family protein [Methanolobus bombayensis]MBP1909003.1 putative membrane protein (TIGR00267 family) [Methanolobus bombayensis]